MPNSASSQNFRFLLPETIYLEAEHLLLAQQISDEEKTNCNISWQAYLNALALLAFEIWLNKRLGDKNVTRNIDNIKTAGNIQIDEFKFCTIATENLLSETICIPSSVTANPNLSAHFYVLLEVLEEEEQVVIRGFLPHNQLIELISKFQLPISDGFYQIPLSSFDIEPNHLLLYQRYLKASEFTTPITESKVTPVGEDLVTIVNTNTIKLSQWLQGVADKGWQLMDSACKPELNLAFATRNLSQDKDTKRSKIIDLGLSIDNHKLLLLIAISSDITKDNNQKKIQVLVQLKPIYGENYLPHNVKLFLISKTGTTLQEVISRTHDNYIQLNIFKGKRGTKFSIGVSLGESSIRESFEL